MKRIRITHMALVIITGALLTSCSSATEKVENAQEDVVEATERLTNETEAYSQEMAEYKKLNEDKIASNQKTIEAFNARIDNQKSDVKAEYKKKIASLNNKNTDLQKRMADFKAENKESWEAFKIEFENDMEELSQAFKEFTIKE